MNGVKYASVWVEELLQWVPLSQITVIQFFEYEGKRCSEFKFDNKVCTSYIEYKEL